jgi:hypothetical protein
MEKNVIFHAEVVYPHGWMMTMMNLGMMKGMGLR